MDRSSSARRSAYELCLFVVASVPLLAALWWAPVLPTHDGPKHLYASHVRFHIADPAFASWFEPAYPPTSIGFTLLYGVLEWVFSWRVAYGLAWTAVVLVTPVAICQLARAFDPKRAPLFLLGVAGAVHWSVQMGFANYVPSVGLGLLTVAIGVAKESWSVRRELLIYALLSITCLFHPVGAQFAAIGLFVYRALGSSRGRAIRELGAMTIGCTPALVVSLLSRDALADLTAKGVIRPAIAVPLSLLERLHNFTTTFLCGPLWRSAPLLVFGALGIGFSVAALSRTMLVRPRSVDRGTVTVLAIAGAMLALALSTPLHGASWEFMQPRFIPPAVFAALALLPLERLAPRARALATTAFLVCAVSSNLWVVDQHRRFAAQHEDAFSGLGVGEHRSGRTLLPIIAREETGYSYQTDRTRTTPHAAFIFNLGQLYAVDRAAVTPYSFSFLPNIHPVHYVGQMGRTPRRDYGEFFKKGADPVVRERELVRLATFGTGFDDLLFYGSAEDVARLVALGYRPETRQNGFMIAQLIGCPLEVTVDAGSASGELLLGWVPADRIVHTFALEPGGSRRFQVDHGSCGSMWLRWSPAETGDAAACRGASANSNLLLEAGTSAAHCEVVPVAAP